MLVVNIIDVNVNVLLEIYVVMDFALNVKAERNVTRVFVKIINWIHILS